MIVKYYCRQNEGIKFNFLLKLVLSFLVAILRINIHIEIFATILALTITFFTFKIFYSGLKEILISIFAWVIIGFALEFLVVAILVYVMHFDTIIGEITVAIISVFMAKAIEYSIVFAIFSKKEINKISRAFDIYQYIFFILSLINLCNMAVLFYQFAEKREVNIYFILYFSISFVFLIISLLYLLDQLNRIVKENQERKLIDEENRLYQRFIGEIDTMTEHLNQLNHDYRYHLQYLSELTEKSKAKEAVEYLKQMLIEYSDTGIGLIDNHPAISFLLLQKARFAKENDIIFKNAVPNLLNTKISETDLNIILANLLDNALEAVVKIEEEKIVSVKIYNKKDLLFINVMNTFNGNFEVWGSQYLSTKENPNLHGHGLKSIKRICDKLDGELKITNKNNIFEVLVILPI